MACDETHNAFHQAAEFAWNEYLTTGLHITQEEADTWLAELEFVHDDEPPPCHI